MNDLIFEIALAALIFIVIPFLTSKVSDKKQEYHKITIDKEKHLPPSLITAMFLWISKLFLIFLLVKNVDDTLIAILLFASVMIMTSTFTNILSEAFSRGEKIKERIKERGFSHITDYFIERVLIVFLLFYSSVYAFAIYAILTYIF